MRVREREFGLRVQGPSRRHAMARARRRGQMGAQKRALVGSRGRAIRRARARGPSNSWSEGTKCYRANAPRPSCGRTAVRACQVRGANAPHTCVASAECNKAHRADTPRPSRGRAVAPVVVDFGNLRSCGRATKRGGRAIAPVSNFSMFFSFSHFFVE
ncbi:hypothetical protein PIB30_021080 [Stylosanthes scabra]|uniref:Uncharacterized protein n=1 Tax=Stylosanthes scabra TaxID=79078 RepID=A0ABU6Y730_9FABA|nr:hypothetical protein [Stylosanthes scabra]